MIPQKAKTVYPEISEILNLPEDVVEAVVDFYWKEIKKNLMEPDCLNLRVEDLGTFEIRRRILEREIEKYTGLIKHAKPGTYAKHMFLNSNMEKLARFEKLLELYKVQDEKKKQVRETQKNGKTV